MATNALFRFFKSFRDDTRGAITLEFVLVMPFLFWAFMASYVFYDGYRQSSVNLKAAHTISDIISRETAAIDDDYIDSMYEVFRMLTRTNSPITMRISVVRWDREKDRHFVEWSETRNRSHRLTDGNIRDIEDRLPLMAHGDRLILVETNNTFVPLFNVGLENTQLENFVYTRPRFAPQVVWAS